MISREVLYLKRIFWFSVISIVLLIAIKVLFISYWATEDTVSLVINLLTECISVLVTVFIIDGIIRKRENEEQVRLKQKHEDEHKRIVSSVLGNSLTSLFVEISSVYVNFVLKEPATLSKEMKLKEHKDNIVKLLNEMDTHVIAGFRAGPIKCYIVDESNLSIPSEQVIDYQEYCEYIFKAKIQFHIDKFVQRYVSIIPDDLKISIYTIDNSIADFTFITSIKHGHKVPMPTREEDIVNLKREFNRIGESLVDIYKVIDAAS